MKLSIVLCVAVLAVVVPVLAYKNQEQYFDLQPTENGAFEMAPTTAAPRENSYSAPIQTQSVLQANVGERMPAVQRVVSLPSLSSTIVAPTNLASAAAAAAPKTAAPKAASASSATGSTGTGAVGTGTGGLSHGKKNMPSNLKSNMQFMFF